MRRNIVCLLLLFVLLICCSVTMSLLTGTDENGAFRIAHQRLSDHESEDDEEESLLKRVLNENPLIVDISVVVLLIMTAKLSRRGRLIVLGLYFIFILYMTVLFREVGEREYNFDLFWSYRQMIFDPELGWEVINNILLFIPFGALLYSVNPKLFFVVPLLTVTIESIQYFGGIGLCELDDIFGNTLGGAIGWEIMELLNRIKPKMKRVNDSPKL